jgi:hypothetical protein
MWSILTFLCYLVAAVFITLTFFGAGRPIFQILGRTSKPRMNITRITYEFVIGFCAVYIFSVLIFTYLPANWALKISNGLLFLLLSIGLGTEVFRIKKISTRNISLLSWAGFAILFLLVYLPFFKAKNIFLASEGGGDITGYLGFAKMYSYTSSYPSINAPRLLIGVRTWLENTGLATINRLPVYAVIEPALNIFTRNLPASTPLPTLFFFPLQFIFPLEVLYMSLWMTITAIVPVLVAIAIPKKVSYAPLWIAIAALLMILSAGFQSIFLNHYIYQLTSIFMIAAFYSALIRLLISDSSPLVLIAICTLSMIVVCISYFPSTPAILILAAWGAILLLLSNRWKKPEWSILSYLSLSSLGWICFLIFIFLPILVEPYSRLSLSAIEIVTTPNNPQQIDEAFAFWGPTVHDFKEIWSEVQGTLIHNLAQPNTTLDLHMLLNYRFALGSIALLLLTLFPIISRLRKQWKSPNKFWQGYSPIIILAIGSLLCVLSFVFICRTHSYTFDKMAMLMLPITVASIIILLAVGLDGISGRLKIFTGTAATLFLLIWLAGEAQTRLYQIQSFYTGANRTAILYTQDYQKSLPIPNNPSRTFMYTNLTGAGTSYFLMEATLAGKNTFPANNYYHSYYPKFLSQIDFTHSNYVISRGNYADTFDIAHFYLGADQDYAVPIDPNLNPTTSQLPQKIAIDRPTPEGTGIVLRAGHPWHVICRPFENNTPCSIEAAMMGEKKYHSLTGQPNKNGTRQYEIKANAGLQVLHCNQCQEILFTPV